MSLAAQLPLFFEQAPSSRIEALGPSAFVLRGFASALEADLLSAVEAVERGSPFRQMGTAGGRKISARMTNCGTWGWTSGAKGYGYVARDPSSDRPWPRMPDVFRVLAEGAVEAVGLGASEFNACLLNRYAPGDRMGLHQDRDEADLTAPIVSVSLGLPVEFLFAGLSRTGSRQRVWLENGDVVVFGGEDRLRFHGVAPLKPGRHPALGACRINLTLRSAR